MSYQVSGKFLIFFLKGVLLFPNYSFLVVDRSPLQSLPEWEQIPGLWWNLFSTQLERHALFSLLSTLWEHKSWIQEQSACPSEVVTYVMKCG